MEWEEHYRSVKFGLKEKGLAPVFLDSRLEHQAGWICAHYKSFVLLLLKLMFSFAKFLLHLLSVSNISKGD